MATRTAPQRVLVLGRDIDPVTEVVAASGLTVVERDPDVVLTWGGDGVLLGSEREWPGVPKLPLRNSRHGKRCTPHEIQEALARLLAGDLPVSRWTKVEGETGGMTLVGLNDVLVHNSRPTSSVRYRVWIDGKEFGDEIVGDGVVLASAFGSTAYYRSITGSTFHLGLGLAFNNSTEPVDHLVLPAETRITVRITRGPALLAADNDPRLVEMNEGDEVELRRHPHHATVLGLTDAGA